MKTKIITFILLIALLLTLLSPTINVFAAETRDYIDSKETPVAMDKNGDEYSFEKIAKEMGMQVYKSEEEYRRVVEEQNKRDMQLRNTATTDTNVEKVVQTFTVMDWKREKPVSGAILLVNGTPRFTDSDGKVRISDYKNKDILVRVEKDGYLPYIGSYEVTADNKTIWMKKPNDDIELYAAVLEYEGEYFNLVEEPCYVNLNMTSSYSELVVESNVACEEYWLYVNGEPYVYSDNGIFEDIVWSDFNAGDIFELQGVYQGIESQMVNLNLEIVKNEKLNLSMKNQSIGTNIDSEKDFGLIGNVDFDFDEVINSTFVDVFLNSGGSSYHLTNDSQLMFNFLYDAREGTITLMVGYSYTAISDEKTIKKLQSSIDESNSELKELREESYQLQRDLAEKKKANKSLADMEKAKKKLKEHNEKKAQYPKYANSKQAKRDLAKIVKVNEVDYKNAIEKVAQLTEKANNSKNFDQLRQERAKIKNIRDSETKKMNVIKNKKIDFNLDFKISGTIKYSLIKNSVVEFVVAGGVEVNFSVGGNFVLYFVPCFWEINIYGGVDIEVYLLENGKWISLEDFLSRLYVAVNLGITGEVGVGCRVGSTKLGVSGFLDINVNISGNMNKGGLNGKGELNLSLGAKLYLLLWTHDISHTWKVDLFDTTQKTAMMARQCSFEMMNYGSINTPVFADRLYAASMPKMEKIDEKLVLTWIEDCESRDNYNRTKLVYSVYDGVEWSEPKAVADDGKGDFYQEMYSDGNELYVTWQKVNKVMTEQNSLEEFVSNSEIVLAQFDTDTNSFGAVQYLTTNDSADLMPQFALKESTIDPVTVVWHSNSENNILSTSGVNTVYYASENTNWSIQELTQENVGLSDISAAYINGNLNVTYTIDKDGDYLTNDGVIKIANKETITSVGEEGASFAKYISVDNKPTLTYYNNKGELCSLNNEQFSQVMISGGVQNYYDYFENENGKAVFYSKLNGEYKQAYCALYDTNKQEWVTDILLTNEMNHVMNPIGRINDDGSIAVTYNIQDENGNTALCMTTKKLNSSIMINNAFVTQTENGYDLDVEVVNTGDTNIHAVRLNVLGKDIDMQLDSPLLVGEKRYLTFDFEPQNEIKTEITLSAINNNIVVSSCTYNLNIEHLDLQLIGSLSVVNEKQFINVKVNNLSKVDVDNAKILVYVNGEIRQEHELELTNGSGELRISFDNIQKDDYIYIMVESSEYEEITSNNSFSTFAVLSEITAPDISEITGLLDDAKKLRR